MNRLAFVFIIVIGSTAFSDDCYMGTQGGNVYPQKSTTIKMVEEYVSINLSKNGGDVYCKFWFVNNGKDDTVYVGFPDQKINPAGYNEPAKAFCAIVNRKSVKVFKDSIIETLSGDTIKNSWYYWKTYFPSNDTVIIENRYKGLWGGSYCEKQFEYIIGTGNKWAGPIGKGRIVFHHGNLLSNLFVVKSLGKGIEALRPIYYEDSTVYEFSNYKPKDHEAVDLWLSSYWYNLAGQKCPGFYTRTDTLLNKKEMVNELFARCGNIFINKNIQKLYSKKPWYKPKRKLNLKDLPTEIQTYIRNLTEEVGKE